MVRITIDKATQEKLLSSGEVVELVDESGRLLGRILPPDDKPHSAKTAASSELTDEELDRLREYDGPGITSEELLARLRNKKKGA